MSTLLLSEFIKQLQQRPYLLVNELNELFISPVECEDQRSEENLWRQSSSSLLAWGVELRTLSLAAQK